MASKRVAGVFYALLVFVVQPNRAAVAQQLRGGVAEAQQKLLVLTTPGVMEAEVPPAVQNAIGNLKKSLVLQTDAVLTHLPSDVAATSARRRLSATMPAATVGTISDKRWRAIGQGDSCKPVAGLYGGTLTLSVSRPKPSLLLVQESFVVACGDDNILMAYSDETGAWKRILLWESPPYDKISGAFGDTYQALLLKTEHDRHPLLLVLHGTPWCTSTMSAFSMDVLELGSTATSAPLWHGEHGYRRLDLDPALTVRPTADGFEVRTSVPGGGDAVSRKGVMRYAVTATGVHRVEPLATNGLDSIVEWLQMPRIEAADFADQPAGSLTWKEKPRTRTFPIPALARCARARTQVPISRQRSQANSSALPGRRTGPGPHTLFNSARFQTDTGSMP